MIRDLQFVDLLMFNRFVADRQEPTFETIEELLEDKTIKFSMLSGQGPVLERLKKELIEFWTEEAAKGMTLEEYARYVQKQLSDRLFHEEGNLC